MTRVHLGISTCPNDTFTFHAILTRKVDFRGLDFDIELLDVQELNERLAAGDFDVAKASFHAALSLADQVGVLPTGSALGFGVGPLLLAHADTGPPRDPWQDSQGQTRIPRVLCPGADTTAHLLYRLFHRHGQVDQTIFSDIMPALRSGTADYGVCIHEGRFTWQSQGLYLIEDLGHRWEQETGAPLPLGGIVARHRLGDIARTVQQVLQDSLEYARRHPDETYESMRRYAQEFDDAVLMAHVDLYVNEWTWDLGSAGEAAIAALDRLGRAAGAVGPEMPPLRIIGR